MKKLRADWRLSQRSEVVSFVEGLSVLEMTEGIILMTTVPVGGMIVIKVGGIRMLRGMKTQRKESPLHGSNCRQRPPKVDGHPFMITILATSRQVAYLLTMMR